MIAALMAATDQVGWAWRASAARPVTCGVAIEVPDITTPWVPVPMPTERIDTPGAVTSGLRWPSTTRGPCDEKLATTLKPGLASVIAVRLTVAPSSATIADPLVLRAPRNGMVTVNGSPVSGFDVIGPSNGGNVVALLIMRTAAAPACCPKIARATRAQVPRVVTTSLPATPAYSAGLQPRLTVPLGLRSTFTCSGVPGRGALLASMVLMLVVPDVSRAPGNDGVGS